MRPSPHHIPTTASSTAFSTPSPAIATAINTATRSLHTELNRLIIARLPLALPPHTTTPLLYSIGISAFAQVYTAFESAWLLVNEEEEHTPQLNENLRHALENLLDYRIQRSAILEQDISCLLQLITQCHGSDAANTIASWRKSEILQEYLFHISAAISARPHVIVAYAWVMYMALFSGGRWIRMVLKDAGSEFWEGRGFEAHKQTALTGFTFLTFTGSHDGEDTKAAFKQQLAVVEEVLGVQEKQDIVDEARYIFQKSIDLVHELDDLAVTVMSKLETTSLPNLSATKVEQQHRIVRESLKIEKIKHSTLSTQALQLLLAIAVFVAMLVVVDVAKRNMMMHSGMIGFG